jgi:serine/threonine protein kinase
MENLLLDNNGNIRITDFGLSHKITTTNKRVVSYSGTALYLAPEMFVEFGHAYGVDYWALGVLAFIMLTQEVWRLLFALTHSHEPL